MACRMQDERATRLNMLDREEDGPVRTVRNAIADLEVPAAASAYAEAARRATNVAERDHLIRQAAHARAAPVTTAESR